MKRTALMLAALMLFPVATVHAQSAGSFAIGEPVSGNLQQGRTETRYDFEGTADQLVTLTMNSDAFDTYLVLRGPSGGEIASDDDSGGSLNSRIGPIALPETGRYTVVARSLGGGGPFDLNVSETAIEQLEFPGFERGALTAANPTRIYRFSAEAGDTVSLGVESGDFDTLLSLSVGGMGGTPIASDDDSGAGLNSQIGPLTLATTGEFFVTVSSYGSSGFGSFDLRGDRVDLREIAFDEPVVVDFTDDEQIAWLGIDVPEDLYLNVTVDSGGSIDTMLRLRDPDNNELGFNDDGGSGMDPELEAVLIERPGMQTLELRPFTPGATGRVTLRVRRNALQSLDDGARRVAVGPKATLNMLSFSGSAGETVTIHVREIQDRRTDPTITVTQNGNEVSRVQATGVAAFSATLSVPADGSAHVRVEESGGTPAVFEVRLER